MDSKDTLRRVRFAALSVVMSKRGHRFPIGAIQVDSSKRGKWEVRVYGVRRPHKNDKPVAWVTVLKDRSFTLESCTFDDEEAKKVLARLPGK